MKTLRFFTVPTLLGWLAAYATCLGLQLGYWYITRTPAERLRGFLPADYLGILLFGGVTVVLPTYLFVILPLSVVDLRRTRRGRPMGAETYALALLATGVAGTVCLAAPLKLAEKMGGTASFLLPFLPYALVVAATAKWLRPEPAQPGTV